MHPLVQQNYKINETAQVSYASLDMDTLVSYMEGEQAYTKSYKTLQDQIVYRDVCFVIDKDKSRDSVMDAIKAMDTIGDIEVFDIYA